VFLTGGSTDRFKITEVCSLLYFKLHGSDLMQRCSGIKTFRLPQFCKILQIARPKTDKIIEFRTEMVSIIGESAKSYFKCKEWGGGHTQTFAIGILLLWTLDLFRDQTITNDNESMGETNQLPYIEFVLVNMKEIKASILRALMFSLCTYICFIIQKPAIFVHVHAIFITHAQYGA